MLKKSSYSGDNGCVYVEHFRGMFYVKDTTEETSIMLIFNKEEWDAFIQGVKAGEFDATELAKLDIQDPNASTAIRIEP
jgi:hypothetical protein